MWVSEGHWGSGEARGAATAGSHHKIFPHKTFSKGWVAQEPFVIGSLTAALRFSKGWVRKDLNLVMGIGCTAGSMKGS